MRSRACRTRHTRSILFGLLTIRMFPHILLAMPFFVWAATCSLIDTYPIMILALVAINQPFTIWLMRSFFVDVPIELDEAARIDGCNNWQVFWRVILPVVRPGLVVTAAVQPAAGLQRVPVRPGPDRPADQDAAGRDRRVRRRGHLNYWSLSAAAAIGIMLPIALFMMLLQRHLVRGLTFGAVKG